MSYERFNAKNSTLLLIDHQIGTAEWMHSMPLEGMKRNTLALARTAAALEVPTILTTSLEEEAQGPLFPELAEILPEAFANRIKRWGKTDAMADTNFYKAVKATNRKKLIIAGLTTEVCVLYPALSAVLEGYDVQVIADASGSTSKFSDEIALDRIRQSGAAVASTVQILAEMVDDWSVDAGPVVMDILSGIYTAMAD